jgi:hypothetical protein
MTFASTENNTAVDLRTLQALSNALDRSVHVKARQVALSDQQAAGDDRATRPLGPLGEFRQSITRGDRTLSMSCQLFITQTLPVGSMANQSAYADRLPHNRWAAF